MKDRRPTDFPAFDAASAAEQRIAEKTRTLVVGPYLSAKSSHSALSAVATNSRSVEARLDEAVGLAAAIDLKIMVAEVAPLRALRPASYIGTGKIEHFRALVEEHEVGLVLFDCALTPVQQRNLEKALQTKVIDRTGLILEIFGRRARTREGALQVELAHLAYQKGRLVRSWTHLERQRGGFGFLGGPGETQIEADRRMIQDRMKRIEQDLDDVKRTRGLHRSSRDKVPFPTIALVGYTNAGKSTLFNRMTKAEVLAKDMLFATLDPTTRVISLPHGRKAILSDTVGFISDLPTMLVAAFRATLEDVIQANLILHVRDVAHEDAEAQGEDVRHILTELGIGENGPSRILEVWNKADLLQPEERERLLALAERPGGQGGPILVSALTGEGFEVLLREAEARLSKEYEHREIAVPASDGADLAWLYENCSVIDRRTDDEGTVHLNLQVPPERLKQFSRKFSRANET